MDNNPTPNNNPAPADATASPAPETPVVTPTEPTTAPTPTPGAEQPAPKSHLVAILLSIFVGTFGIDRFYLGHIGLGVAKLLLSWLTFGIWWIIDVILIATKKVKNVTWEA